MEAEISFVDVTHTYKLIELRKAHFPLPNTIVHIYNVVLNASLHQPVTANLNAPTESPVLSTMW